MSWHYPRLNQNLIPPVYSLSLPTGLPWNSWKRPAPPRRVAHASHALHWLAQATTTHIQKQEASHNKIIGKRLPVHVSALPDKEGIRYYSGGASLGGRAFSPGLFLLPLLSAFVVKFFRVFGGRFVKPSSSLLLPRDGNTGRGVGRWQNRGTKLERSVWKHSRQRTISRIVPVSVCLQISIHATAVASWCKHPRKRRGHCCSYIRWLTQTPPSHLSRNICKLVNMLHPTENKLSTRKSTKNPRHGCTTKK